jgi:SAM-dependent methyltransferase
MGQLMTAKLNIGSGRDWREDCVNADISPNVLADWVLDITRVKWNETIQTRFGNMLVRMNLFDVVYCMDVLEHVSDLTQAMTNIKHLMKDGGELHVRVPYDLSYGAWQDPTHVRAFNERSWIYYGEWARYLGWFDSCFEMISLDYEISDYGKTLNLPIDQLTKMPRAIDSMQVKMRKIVVDSSGH